MAFQKAVPVGRMKCGGDEAVDAAAARRKERMTVGTVSSRVCISSHQEKTNQHSCVLSLFFVPLSRGCVRRVSMKFWYYIVTRYILYALDVFLERHATHRRFITQRHRQRHENSFHQEPVRSRVFPDKIYYKTPDRVRRLKRRWRPSLVET